MNCTVFISYVYCFYDKKEMKEILLLNVFN